MIVIPVDNDINIIINNKYISMIIKFFEKRSSRKEIDFKQDTLLKCLKQLILEKKLYNLWKDLI